MIFAVILSILIIDVHAVTFLKGIFNIDTQDIQDSCRYPIHPDRHITFRILAPKAESVRLKSNDIPGGGQASGMTKEPNGVWKVTVGPVDHRAYRYIFAVDGMNTAGHTGSPTNGTRPAPDEFEQDFM